MCEGARATLANNHLACYAPPPTSPHWEVDLRMGDFAEQKLVLTATAVIINIKGGGGSRRGGNLPGAAQSWNMGGYSGSSSDHQNNSWLSG